MTKLEFLIPGDLNLPTGGYAYDREILARLSDHGVDARHVRLPDGYPNPNQQEIRETVSLLRGLPTDHVVMVDGLALGAMPVAAVKEIRQPLVALCHHPLCLEEGLSNIRKETLKASEGQALALSSRVIVTSPSTRSLLSREFAVPAEKITVAVPGTNAAPRARGTGRPLQLLAVGSVVPRKGYHVLIEALAGLGDSDWHLAIAGAKDRNPATTLALEQLVGDRGLQKRVTFLGPVDAAQLEQLYAAADLFVMPSLFEGYGMALAEAMARGLPVVCTTGGAAAETVPDDAGLKVPPGDVAALHTALARAINDDQLRGQIARASWTAGQQLPSWDTTAQIIAADVKAIRP